MANLLVNADDFGLHEAVNTAIAKAVNFGSVNSVSVIANGRALDFHLLQQFVSGGIFTGAHLTWVGEPWITEPIFISDWKQLVKRLLTGGRVFRQKMRQEAHSQINRLIDNGIYPDHIDSHQHVHHFPGIWDITVELKEAYNIQRIRVAKVGRRELLRMNFPGLVLNAFAANKPHQAGNFTCAGIKNAGNYNAALFANELKLSNGNNTELIVHPGANNHALNESYLAWNFNWEQEFNALVSEGFLRSVADNGFILLKR